MVIVLDTFLTSSTGKLPASTPTVLDRCREWVSACESAGHQIVVPAVSYYEALREMELRRATAQIDRLKTFCLEPRRFLPLTTGHLELAARLWAEARRAGRPTADPQALDCDALLAAQALSLGVAPAGLVVATSNPGHISRWVPAELWTDIHP